MKGDHELFQRIYTAIPLVMFALVAIFYLNSISFIIFNTLLMWCLGWEWIRLCGYTGSIGYGYLIFLSLGCAVIAFFPIQWVFSFALFIGVFLIIHISFVLYQRKLFKYSSGFLASIGGICLTVNWHSLFFLKETPVYLGMGLLTVVLADTLAYGIGRSLGVHLLAPFISPRKTWEGSLAGLIGPVLLIFLIDWFTHLYFYLNTKMAIVMICTTVTAIAGDLFESIIKRQAGLKESGNGLPGHGGWLDRFDSLVCAIPIFAATLFYLL